MRHVDTIHLTSEQKMPLFLEGNGVEDLIRHGDLGVSVNQHFAHLNFSCITLKANSIIEKFNGKIRNFGVIKT